MRAHLLSSAALAALLLAPRAARAQPVVYYGGRVISNVEVVQVSWTGAVDPTLVAGLSGFYTAIVKSPFIDWLTEYDTIGKVGYVDGMPGSNQHIGRGTFAGSVVITPANGKTALLDAEIQAELAAQLDSGALPPPKVDAAGNVNTLYMIDFPAGYTISLLSLQSCQQFGAYHFTIQYGGKNVPYGVHPNCGYDFDTSTVVHSHELNEALTDMEVGLAVQDAPTTRPIAWATVDNTAWESLETADLCQGNYEQVAGYLVQKIWSNFAGGCVAQIPICDGASMPPACRPCNAFDSGNACSGEKPACATSGPESGHCVTCTTAYPDGCPARAPVCDESKYVCVGCLANADCTDPEKPVCDVATTTCGPCKSDDQCATGVCDTMGDSEDGECVDCNVDTDCSLDFLCAGHVCIPPEPEGSGSTGSTGSGGDAPRSGEEPAAGEDSGCACRTLPAGDATAGSWLGAVVALAISRRRRRCRRVRQTR